MLRHIRHRLLAQAMGGNLGSAFFAGWAMDKVNDLFDGDPEDIDRVVLRPGETYVVSARPPMSRREAKLLARSEHLLRRERKAARPSEKQVKAARRLERAQHRAAKTSEGSRRSARRELAERKAAARFDKAFVASRRQRKAEAIAVERSDVDAEREQRRRVALAGTPRRRRRPVSKTYP